MSKTTRATLALTKLGVKFALHAYDYDPDADRVVFRPPRPSVSNRDAC